MSSWASAVMTNNEIVLLEIFIAQVTVAITGTLSIDIADWVYHRGRIHQVLHSVWVSCSITVICLPLLAWTTNFLASMSALLSSALSPPATTSRAASAEYSLAFIGRSLRC